MGKVQKSGWGGSTTYFIFFVLIDGWVGLTKVKPVSFNSFSCYLASSSKLFP